MCETSSVERITGRLSLLPDDSECWWGFEAIPWCPGIDWRTEYYTCSNFLILFSSFTNVSDPAIVTVLRIPLMLKLLPERSFSFLSLLVSTCVVILNSSFPSQIPYDVGFFPDRPMWGSFCSSKPPLWVWKCGLEEWVPDVFFDCAVV